MSELYTRLTESNYLKLHTINRYSNKNLIIPESTAVHTIECQLIALWMYDRLTELGVKLNKRDFTYRCLTHDLDETVMCDIPRNVKYHDTDTLHKFNAIAHELMLSSDMSNEIVDDVEHAKHDCLEGELVGFIDVLQALTKIESEYLIQRKPFLADMLIESLGYLDDKLNCMEHSTPLVDEFLKSIIKSCVDRVHQLLEGNTYTK